MRHPHRLARTARLKPALLTLLLAGAGPYGCVVDAQLPEHTAAEADASASPDVDGQQAAPEPEAPEPEASEPEAPEPEAPDDDLGADGPDAPLLGWPLHTEACVAACEARQRNLGSDALCIDEGVACLDACDRVGFWMSPYREAGLDCLAEDYICYESLATCAMRRSPMEGANLQVTLNAEGLTDLEGAAVWISQRWEDVNHERSFAGGATYAEVRNGAFSATLTAWVAPFGGQLTVWIDTNGDGTCDLGDVATQVWLSLYETPLELPTQENHPLATGQLAATLNAEQVSGAILARPREAESRCPDAF